MFCNHHDLSGFFSGHCMVGTSGCSVWGSYRRSCWFVSVYKTVEYYDRLESQAKTRRTYMPPTEEIYEEFDLPGKDEKS
jgi:hypothetical protein